MKGGAPQRGSRVVPAARGEGAFAAIDLGTNACRLLVGVPAGSTLRIIDSLSRTVRLGEGLQAANRLSEAAMARTLQAMAAITMRLQRRPIRRLRAVATEACRRAENGPAFLAHLEQQTGVHFETITPREEAELAVESCIGLLGGGDRRALLFDIGGGSTELAWLRLPAGALPEVTAYHTVPMGVVTLSEQFGPDGDFGAMVDQVAGRLAPFEAVHAIQREIAAGGVGLLGTSGTVTTVAGIALDLPRYRRPLVDGRTLTGAQVDEAIQRIVNLGRPGLDQHPCVGPDRAEFVIPGCAVLAAIRRSWPAPRVTVADRGLREGMLVRLMRAEGIRVTA